MEDLIISIRRAIFLLPDSALSLVDDLHSILIKATCSVAKDENFVKESVQNLLKDSLLNSRGDIKEDKVNYAKGVLVLFDMK